MEISKAELASAAYTEAPADCAATHTSTTIAVAVLPDGDRHARAAGQAGRAQEARCTQQSWRAQLAAPGRAGAAGATGGLPPWVA